MGTEAPDAISEVIIQDHNDSQNPIALLQQIQQDQARQNSELFNRIDALTQALMTNITGEKRAARLGDSGPKHKIARSNDESNGSQGNSSSSNIVTRACAESDRESPDYEGGHESDDDISIPDQPLIDREIEAHLEEGPKEPEETGQTDDILDQIAGDLSMAEDIGESINPQLAKIVEGLWANKLAEEKLKEKLKKYPTPENCSNMIVPKCNHEIWTNVLSSALRFNDLNLQRAQCHMSKAANAMIFVCNQLIAHKANCSTKLETNKLISPTIDALALLGNSVQELSQRRREAVKGKIPHKLQHLASNVPPHSTLLFGDDINKRIQAISSTNKALTGGSATAFKRSEYQYSNSKGHSWQYSKNRQYPQRGSASGRRGFRQSRRGRIGRN